MRSEELISLAAAHGVDLIAAVKVATPAQKSTGTLTRTKRGIKSTFLVPVPDNRVRGKQTESSVKPMWTIAELGQAAQGAPEIAFKAACFAWAGSQTDYWTLLNTLHDRAKLMRERRNWPLEIIDIHQIKRPYLAHLAKLVLDHDAHPSLFNACPELFGIYLNITMKTWKNGVEERFHDLQYVWRDWLQTAARIIQSHLREPEEGE